MGSGPALEDALSPSPLPSLNQGKLSFLVRSNKNSMYFVFLTLLRHAHKSNFEFDTYHYN